MKKKTHTIRFIDKKQTLNRSSGISISVIYDNKTHLMLPRNTKLEV